MTLADAAARKAIGEDLASTFVVEAAAGTGKTTEMISRIIATIRTGATTLERIVAVTFTEKAAGEMKLRLRTELERARNASTGIEHKRFERALAELEVARVGTIHSFCTDLLRERPIEARVDPLFEVAAEDEADRIFQQAFDTWFQGTLGNPGEGVRRILRRDAPTEILRSAALSLVDRRDFDGAWRRDPFERDPQLDRVIEELAGLGGLAPIGKPNDPLARFLTKLDLWIQELGRRDAVRARDHDGLEAELAKVSRWYEWKLNGRGQLYADGVMRADVLVQRDAAKAALTGFLEAADSDLAACLHRELQPVIAEYERLKARAGRLDFLDLLAKSRDLLRDDHRIRAEMQQRFSHFYVDEFQDTDPLQVEILMLLCADDPAVADPDRALVQPGKLFVVGDPKQAIYRFRRADVALYEAVKRRLVAGGARLVHLSTSFRGVPAIQSAINAAFAPAMQGDGQAEYVPLEAYRGDVTTQPAIVALPVPDPYSERGAITGKAIQASYPDAVAAFVDWLIHTSGWTISGRDDQRHAIAGRHICLVLRRFQSYGEDVTRPYVRALEARGISHVLVGGRSFYEREETDAIRNVLHAIEWPDDELAVYATLHGPFFAFHDEDLIAFKHLHGRLYPVAWLDPARLEPLTALRDIAAALAILGELHRLRNRRPIAETLAQFLAITRGHAGLAVWPAGEQALANVLRVLDLARRFEARVATSFRAFVEKLAADTDRGRQADAPVVEEGTEGVRIMTAHAAKGLEFPVVILCDPTAPIAQERPSRHVDPARRVWLAPLANCVPAELREHTEEILRRDREEGVRLTYVAATRARDLLVVPVIGDEERESWVDVLNPVVYPDPAQRRQPKPAPGVPEFRNDDSVRARPQDCQLSSAASVAPGRHAPRAGTHQVVWWDPRALVLDIEPTGGMRQRQILQADETGENAAGSVRAHAEWRERRATAIVRGTQPTLVVHSVTAASRDETITPPWSQIDVAATDIERHARPNGRRFGTLVHAVLAAIPLRDDEAAIRLVAINQGRLVAASQDEVTAAIAATRAALRHPILVRAAAAEARGELRREVPITLRADGGLVEGIVDLAFAEAGVWHVIDFKTDPELGEFRAAYESQVRLYATAIGQATGCATTGTLLLV